MTKECHIEISGSQNGPVTAGAGRYHEKNGIRYVFFNGMAGEDEISGSVCFDEHRLKYTGHGEAEVQMEFITGTRTSAEYITRYGNIRTEFETISYSMTETEEKICLDIAYSVTIGDGEPDENRVIIKIDII